MVKATSLSPSLLYPKLIVCAVDFGYLLSACPVDVSGLVAEQLSHALAFAVIDVSLCAVDRRDVVLRIEAVGVHPVVRQVSSRVIRGVRDAVVRFIYPQRALTVT